MIGRFRLRPVRAISAAATVVAVVVVPVARHVYAAHTSAGRGASDRRGPHAVSLNAGHWDALPEATPSTLLPGAKPDEHSRRGTEGFVVHPRALTAVYDRPAGTAIARIAPAHLGCDTWLPVIDQQRGCVRVLLPTKPNGSAGWLDAGRVTVVHHRYEIRVHLKAARMRLLKDGHVIGAWPISAGTPQRSISAGRTFLLAAVRLPRRPPLLWYLAAHPTQHDSPDIDHVDDKPVALHRWPHDRPERTGHGCIRVSDDATTALAVVPLGCLVRIQLG